MEQISPRHLADWLADGARPAPLLLDVREPWEVEICSLPGSRHVPMHAIPARLEDLAAAGNGAPLVVVCHHGMRSLQVAAFLERNGFTRVFNLQGGVEAWAQQVDPAMARY